MSAHSRVAHAYDRWSASYDTDHNRTRDLDGETLRRAGLPVAGARVLELGGGTGKNTRWLAEHAARVDVLDLSPGMIAQAQRTLTAPHVVWHLQDITTRWPVSDASLDLVVGNLVLEHVGDLTPVFAEAARALAPGGQLYLCELHPFRQLRGAQAHFTGADGETIQVPAFTHSVSEFVQGGLAAGLVLLSLTEPLEADAPPDAPPRLLAVRFAKPIAPG